MLAACFLTHRCFHSRTTDKDVLIGEFQRLLGPNQLGPEACAFFLDMNNW